MSEPKHPNTPRVHNFVPLVLFLLLLGACSRQQPAPELQTPVASPVATTSTGCGLMTLPQSWTAAMQPPPVTPNVGVHLLARDAATGQTLYERTRSIIVVDPDGSSRTLYKLGTKEQTWSGLIGGGWAVVVEDGAGEDLSTHGVAAYRSGGGERIEVAMRTPDGTGPMPWPVLYEGVVYVQVVSKDAENPRLLTFDLDTGKRSEVSVPIERGPMGRFGDLLVWETTNGVAAFDIKQHRLADVPQQLISIGSAYELASDGQTIVWQENYPGETRVRAYREGWSAVKEISLPMELTNPGMTSWGRYATTFGSYRNWIVDVETGQYVPLTIEWGGATLSGGLLVTSEMATPKGGSAESRVLDLTKVAPLPGCTR